jgi:serine/threonine protein kinase
VLVSVVECLSACDSGNLCSHVKSKRRLPEPEARHIFVQIMAGLEYMHNNGVIHRDVKVCLDHVVFTHVYGGVTGVCR